MENEKLDQENNQNESTPVSTQPGSITFGLPDETEQPKQPEPKVEEAKIETKTVEVEKEKTAPVGGEGGSPKPKQEKPKSLKWKLAIGFSAAGAALAGAGIAAGTCIAIYQKKLNSKVFTITFEPGEGWIKQGKYQVIVDKSVPFAQIAKPEVFNTDAKKVFAGWFLNTSDTLPYLDSQTVTANMTLTAKFVDRDDSNYSIVSFEKGTYYDAVTITGNTVFAIPKSNDRNRFGYVNCPVASVPNYNFVHWSTNSEYPWSDPITNDVQITSDIALYPYFQYDIEKVIIQGSNNVYVNNSTELKAQIVGSWSPINWTVTNVDGTATDKATIESTSISLGTAKLTALKDGVVKVTATPTLETSKATSFEVTLNNPYVSSSIISCYGDVGGETTWWTINEDSLYDTEGGDIKVTKFGGTGEKKIARTAFNLPIYIGQNVAGLKHGFLNGCTSFNNSIIFPDGCKIASLGSYFLYGCSAFNQELKLPNTLLNIGSDFLSKCTSFNNGSDGTTTKDFNIPNQITTIQENFMNGASKFSQKVIMPDTVLYIRENFLYNCTNFNADIVFSDSLTSIGNNFLDSCSLFNKPINLPSSLVEIRAYFMNGCYNFNQDLEIPEGILRIGKDFMFDCSAMVKTITISTTREPSVIFWESDKARTLAVHSNQSAAYLDGITLAGTQADKMKALFPDSPENPYRTLIVKQ